jgi:hypothetical protein
MIQNLITTLISIILKSLDLMMLLKKVSSMIKGLKELFQLLINKMIQNKI